MTDEGIVELENIVELSDNQVAHLGMIQGVINRMASNSFALKALAVTIAAAIIAITGTQQNAPVLASFVGLFPVVVFWLMDAKYLRLEKLYRKLYDHVRKGKEWETFSMNVTTFNDDVSPTLRIAISWSVIWFYLAVAVALLVVSYLTNAFKKDFGEWQERVFLVFDTAMFLG